ncbi:MAG: hypothetical protein MPN21_03525 [Thermoanaerobaculia bacterium]|nr:hypothetical protein [Thermoanaerobaculia bacterium]
MRKMHLTNAAGRDATVDFAGLAAAERYRLGLPGHDVSFHRYLAATETGLHEELLERFGEDYGEALVTGDPEVDLEQVGRSVGETMQIYLSAEGDVLHAPPEVVEVILDPLGDEKERRTPQDVEPNVNEELPIRWTGRRLPRGELVRRFAVARTLQVRHYDGLTYDYLHGMAQELDQADEVVIVGAGPKGRDPLVFQRNGTPYRGFLEGRVDGEKYMLLLHLSNMELKLPEPRPEDTAAEQKADRP